MAGFIKGDVVVIPFPFSDLSGNKRRPALVLATLPGNDVILCQITSRNRKDRFTTSLSFAHFFPEAYLLRVISDLIEFLPLIKGSLYEKPAQ